MSQTALTLSKEILCKALDEDEENKLRLTLTGWPMTKEKSTSRQRSGKGAIRKRLPLQKPRWEKTKLTIRYLYHENIS